MELGLLLRLGPDPSPPQPQPSADVDSSPGSGPGRVRRSCPARPLPAQQVAGPYTALRLAASGTKVRRPGPRLPGEVPKFPATRLRPRSRAALGPHGRGSGREE